MIKQQSPELRARILGLALPVAIGILAIILIAMGVVYFQQKSAEPALEDKITRLEKTLSLPLNISAELQAKYSEAWQAVTTQLTGEEVIVAILNIASESGFDVDIGSANPISIESGKVGKKPIRGSDYQIQPYTISISGDYDDIMNFVQDMDSISTIGTLVLDSLTVKIPVTGDASANLVFEIYTLKK